MQSLHIASTALTPQIDFDFAAHELKVAGESYPEDVHAFYAPVFAQLTQYLALSTQATTRVQFSFAYVNSASTRSLQHMLTLLDNAAASGRQVHVKWIVAEGDDALTELGEDLLHDKQWLRHEIDIISQQDNTN